jgi:ferrochelatase
MMSPMVPPTATAPVAASAVRPKLGVLLLNLGGPEKQGDVEGFLFNLFADPDIIRLPKWIQGLQKPLASLLSKRRAPKSREAYESIGGGSPIMKYTTAQAKALEEALADRGFDGAKCYIGMRYWYPFTEQALEEIKADGINSLVVLPLYPQFSISTSGSSLRVLQETFAKDHAYWGGDTIAHTVVPAWYSRPGYVKAVARLVRDELASYSAADAADGGLHVLFSAHGVPESYIKAGDPYRDQMIECVDLITTQLPAGVTAHLAFQSRVGPVQWLRPYTDDKIPELGKHYQEPWPLPI